MEITKGPSLNDQSIPKQQFPIGHWSLLIDWPFVLVDLCALRASVANSIRDEEAF